MRPPAPPLLPPPAVSVANAAVDPPAKLTRPPDSPLTDAPSAAIDACTALEVSEKRVSPVALNAPAWLPMRARPALELSWK